MAVVSSSTWEVIPMHYLKALALLLVVVGAVNWLLVGAFKFDLVAALTGSTFGQTNILSTIVYVVVGIAGVALLPTLAGWVAGRPEQAA